MTLISLIVVLLAERVANQSKYWQANFYTSHLFAFLQRRDIVKPGMQSATFIAVIGLPTVFLLILLGQIDSSIVRLVLDTAILMVCIGCPALRETYKNYLQAANRGDFQASSMYADQLGHDVDSPATFGQMLVWLNYQHYAAVIIWFALLGPAGSVLYVLTRALHETTLEQHDDSHPISEKVLHILDWIPVRVTALGFLLVGHFSKALPIWLSHFGNLHTPAKTLLCDVARAAEEVEPDETDCTEEPCTLVRLAKRNVMFLVVAISILSLSGWLR
ncbi:beta-lactamase regulator AmpE [Aliiglaciecola litoralis]|uniref:Beta-lactamase regulator AmpE n=1 Tax=Aliiglaciecola litoralis TaxID=582857 RepID=A0ABP3X500_9ALTE